MRVQFRQRGLEKEVRRVTDMQKRAANIEPVMKGRAEAFITMVKRDVFAKGQDPSGEPWAELQEETIERRRYGKGPRKVVPLIDTGRMRDLTFARATKQGIIFGEADIDGKALTHLFGSKTVPRRAFLPVTKSGKPSFVSGPARAWLERAVDRVKQWIEKGKL